MLSSTVLLAFVAAASVHAAAPSKRSTIDCSSKGHGLIVSGGLQLEEEDKAGLWGLTAAAVSGKTGLSIISDTNAGALFNFVSCQSSYMGWNTTVYDIYQETDYYGQLQYPGSDGLLCASIRNGQPDPQIVALRPCATSDDSSQLEQFWSVTKPENGDSSPYFSFVGSRYFSGLPTFKYAYHLANITGQGTYLEAAYEQVNKSDPLALYGLKMDVQS